MTLAPPPPSPAIVEVLPDRFAQRQIQRVTAAHFLPYQLRWIDDDSMNKAWEKSRRIGADYVESYAATVVRLAGKRVNDYWYSSADESAAVEQAHYTRNWLRLFNVAFDESEGYELIDDRDMRVMSFVLPEINGRRPRLNFMTSSPARFRSKGGDVCLSEFAHHKQASEMWKAAAPTAAWGGRISIISTHNGENSEFNNLIRQARRRLDPNAKPRETDLKASVHRVTIDDAIADGLVEKVNATQGTAYTRESYRAHLRSTAGGEDRWLEEFMCVPSGQEGSYFPTVLLRPCVRPVCAKPTADLGAFLAGIQERAKGCTAISAGVDVGRVEDRFTIWVVGRMGTQRITLGLLVYHGQKFSEMETAINASMNERFVGRRVRRMVIDATGLGMQLGERAEDKFRGRVEAVTMTTTVKEDMFTKARAAFEEITFMIPDDDAVIVDWTKIRREVTAAGKSRYSTEKNEHGHSDMATAGALALVADESSKSTARAVQTTGVW